MRSLARTNAHRNTRTSAELDALPASELDAIGGANEGRPHRCGRTGVRRNEHPRSPGRGRNGTASGTQHAFTILIIRTHGLPQPRINPPTAR